jgi:hypothetical protein
MINLNVNRIQAIRDDIARGDGLIEFDAEVLIIGGGGNGNAGGSLGNAGGGAGALISGSWIVPPKTTFDVTVGAGGGGGDTKLVLTSTSADVFVAPGGGNAGNTPQNGGSGGGGGLTSGSAIPATIPARAELTIEPTGFDGGRSFIATGGGGGGGGILGKGQDRTSNVSGGAGGAGIAIINTFVNGLVAGVTTFAYGGDGKSSVATGNGASAPANSGAGGDGGGVNGVDVGGSGGSGLFAIKYEGLPKASGGTITTAGGYTTHVFTGSAQFITTGKSNNNP